MPEEAVIGIDLGVTANSELAVAVGAIIEGTRTAASTDAALGGPPCRPIEGNARSLFDPLANPIGFVTPDPDIGQRLAQLGWSPRLYLEPLNAVLVRNDEVFQWSAPTFERIQSVCAFSTRRKRPALRRSRSVS